MKDKNSDIPQTPGAFFWHVSKPYHAWSLLAVLLVVLASTLSASTSFFFKLIIDAVEANDVEKAMLYGLLYPLAILVVQLLYRASGVAGLQVTTKVTMNATNILIDYLLSHDYQYFTNRFAGGITNKVRSVTGAIENIVPDFLWSQLAAAVSFLVTFIMILLVDAYAAAVFGCLLIALAFVNQKLALKKTALAKLNAEAGTVLQGSMSDIVSNMSTVRQYGREKEELSKLSKQTSQKQIASAENWFFTEKLLLINVLVIFVFAMVMFWSLTQKWSSGFITTGEFILVLALVSQITGAMVFVGRAVNATARAIGEMKEGLDDILLPYEVKDITQAKELSVQEGNISWQNVTFKYGESIVFNNLNLEIRAKEKIGIVGHSGAGKSTFVSLLLRQQDIQSGSISIDGQDIALVTQSSLRQLIALVPQEPMLFHRSIKDNILYGRSEASLAEIIAAAKMANADEFIQKLPDKYETMVGERGIKLSGGQKQRIAIARAMLKNSPLLILDEATSALDSESEKSIQTALHSLMEGKTVIAIAHRLSTLHAMDRIIVFHDGRIVEDGTHKTLCEQNGIYAKLWEHQSGGFITE